MIGAGGSERTAAALAASTIAAERHGKTEVGASHLLDYLDALREGRNLFADANPVVEQRRSAAVVVDAAENSSGRLRRRVHGARRRGTHRRHVGAVGAERIQCRRAGVLREASGRGGTRRDRVRQLASADGRVLGGKAGDGNESSGVRASERRSGSQIVRPGEQRHGVGQRAICGGPVRADPRGVGRRFAGLPRRDARAALDGALLPFGGAKGSNIAMMVEMLAVLSGGSFSDEAAPFHEGSESPRLGLGESDCSR